MKPYIKYAEDVLSGKIVAGELIQLACKRFLDDLKRPDLVFKEDKVDRAIRFIGLFHHFKGEASGQKFNLLPWQAFMTANIVGLYYKDSDTRKYTRSYIEVSRKQGKDCWAAALGLYFMIADGEDGAEVDLAANSRDQAKIAFEFCSTFASQIDKKGKYFHCLRDNIYYKPNKSKMIVFAADDTKLDGFNASFAIVDEYHAAKNSKVYDVIKSSMGMRRNPHLMVITTAGFNMSSPCYRLRNTCIEVLKGLKEEDSLFAAIYEMDINDDWTDSNNWIKSAPNLGVTVKKKYLMDQMQSAINNPSEETGVKTKNFNIWCSSNNNWLQDRFIINSTQKIDFNDFKDQYCYIGVDLSATSDLTAVCYLMPTEQGKYYFKLKYYLPESCIKDSPNREQYRLWANTGQLTLTPGNVTDYDYITKDIINVSKELNIVCIGYDKWNATQWAITCTEQGLPLYEYGQNMGNFNQPTKEFERLILSGKVILDNNEITRWCFQNAQIKEDMNENIKPIKTFKDKKIDGVIAIIQSLGVYFQKPINW